MSPFSAELLRFIGDLRLAEVQVSVAETLDAMRAVAAAGFADRSRMREALAAALVKDEADRGAFDEVFARFFGAGAGTAREAGSPGTRRRMASDAGGGRGDEGASARMRAERARADAPSHGGAPPYASPQANALPGGGGRPGARLLRQGRAPPGRGGVRCRWGRRPEGRRPQRRPRGGGEHRRRG